MTEPKNLRYAFIIMKNYSKVFIFLICLFCFGCNQATHNEDIRQASPISDTGKRPNVVLKNEKQFDDLGDFAHLVPLTIIDTANSNVYEKYGIEFSGNCYDCDLAVISINKKNFDIINVCDKGDFYREEKFSYESSPNEFIVTTINNKFIFTKIDTAPVYELKVLGQEISLKKKRISKFYTQQKALNKFKQHDCGDFGG